MESEEKEKVKCWQKLNFPDWTPMQCSPNNQGKEESETRNVDVPWKSNQPTLSTDDNADADQNVVLPLCPEKVGAVLLP